MKKLVVISIDALFSTDIPYIQQLPAFKFLLENSVLVNEVKPIYPSQTYPCHTSIITGCYPNKHGVFHNEELRPEIGNILWNWDYQKIQVPTLIDILNDQGYKTTSVFWPVSANSTANYCVPEIWSRDYNVSSLDVIKQTSSQNIDHIFDRHQNYLDFKSKEKLDIFATNCMVDIIDEFNPNAIFFHLSLVDNTRHRFGPNGPEIKEALSKCNDFTQSVLDAYLKQNDQEETLFVLLGDHGHVPVKHTIHINNLFLKQKLITLKDDEVVDYKAYCHASSVSAQIYLKDKSNEVKEKVLNILSRLVNEEKVMYIMEKETFNSQYHLDGPFDYVLEAYPLHCFSSQITDNLITDFESVVGKHGHLPSKENKTVFSLKGIDKQGVLYNAQIVDIAPSIMDALSLDSSLMDGHSILKRI